MLLLTLCFLVGFAYHAQSQGVASLNLTQIGFTAAELSCVPMPEVRLLQNRLTPEQLKIVIQATQKAAFQHIGQHDYTAVTLADDLSKSLNGTWHVVIAIGPLVWHVKFDDDFFVSYQFGGLAIVAFRRDKKSEVMIPAHKFREFVSAQLKQLDDDQVRQPAALQAIVTVIEGEYGGQWQAISAQAQHVAVYSTAGSFYQDATKADRVVGLWSIDIPNFQITDFHSRNLPNARPDEDLQYIQSSLENNTANLDESIATFFVNRFKGDWTAVARAEGYGANEDASDVVVQVYDTTFIGAVNENIPIRFSNKGNRTFLADFAKQMADSLAFLGIRILPKVLVENFQRKFGGQWTAVCGDPNKLKLYSTRKDRIYESSVDFGNGKKCVIWLVRADPLIRLLNPISNMFSSMREDSLQATSEALLYNAGDRLAIAQYIVNVMKEKYGAEWHAAVSDTLMSVAVDQNLINYLLVQTADWSVSIMQTNVAAQATDEQQKFFETEAKIALQDFLTPLLQASAGNASSTADGAGGVQPTPVIDPVVRANPDEVIRKAMEETFGGDWASVVVVPNTYNIASTTAKLPLLSAKITVDQATFDVKALQLAPTVLIKELHFVATDKITIPLNATTEHLITAGKTSEDTFGDLVHTLNTALSKTFDLLYWNAYVGLNNESSYTVLYDDPNWMVMRYKNIQVTVFSRDISKSASQFNLTVSEATDPIRSLLSSLPIDSSKSYLDISASAFQALSQATNVPWQIAVGRKGSYAVNSTVADYIVQYETTNNATTPNTMIQYSVWLA